MTETTEAVRQSVRFDIYVEPHDLHATWVNSTWDWEVAEGDRIIASGRTGTKWGARRAARRWCRGEAAERLGRSRSEHWTYEAEAT
jgi:hypothetical protein